MRLISATLASALTLVAATTLAAAADSARSGTTQFISATSFHTLTAVPKATALEPLELRSITGTGTIVVYAPGGGAHQCLTSPYLIQPQSACVAHSAAPSLWAGQSPA
jgi:hypothetical protein